jgi:hypothetical protein
MGKGAPRDMTVIAEERGCAEQLARFFPTLPAVRIPVKISPLRPGVSARQLQESTMVEFGAQEFAIFLTALPLEFDDRIRLSREEGGRSVEAAVVALKYQAGRKAVAVRFLEGRCEWMQP